jgi:predicted nucleic acid-binding protein
MKVVIDTWVLVEQYKGNVKAIQLMRKAAEGSFEAYVSHITIAELVNVISRIYGEREARIQYAYIRHSPLIMRPTTEEVAKNAGLFKTKYGFSLADGFILSTAVDLGADILITGGRKQFEEEWKNVDEIRVVMLDEAVRELGG